MALTITKEPQYPICLVRNPIEIALQTDKYFVSAGTKSICSFAFIYDGNITADGDVMVISIDNTEYTFTYKTTPDDSGYQLSTQGALSLGAYEALIKAQLEANYIIRKYFTVTVLTGFFFAIPVTTFTLTAKDNGPLEISLVSTTNAAAINSLPQVLGTNDVYNDNFTNNIELFCETLFNETDDKEDPNFVRLVKNALYDYPKNESDDFISRFRLDKLLYDYMEKIYTANLNTALPYVANAPIAHHILKRFYFRYYEVYGIPASEKKLNFSDIYTAAITGHGFLGFPDRKTLNGIDLLHYYDPAILTIAPKQWVDTHQPAWTYFVFSPNDVSEMIEITGLKCKVYFDDGTDTTFTIVAPTAFEVNNGDSQAFWLKSGYTQLNLSSYNTVDKSVYAWDVIVEVDGDDATVTRKFYLDCCSQYKTYLMYRNSKGGYDTVTVTAPKEMALELTEGKEVERFYNDDYEKNFSQFEATIPEARQSLKCNIGFRKESEAEVLQELLMSKYVFVVPKYNTDLFIPVNIDRKTIALGSEDDFVRNFTFEFAPAHNFNNFNNAIWLR